MKLSSITENEYEGLEDADEFLTDHDEECHVCGTIFFASHWDNDYTCEHCGRTVCRECEMSGPKVLCSIECKLRYYTVPGMVYEAVQGPLIRGVTWRPAILTVQFPGGEVWEYMVYEDKWVRDLMRRHKRNAGRLVAAIKNLPGVIATKKT